MTFGLSRKSLLTLPLLALTATAAQSAVCPVIGSSSDCSAVITRSSAGVYSVASTGVGPYDGSDDSLVGFVNNGNDTVFSLTLTGSNIFGFDGDGVDKYSGGGLYGTTGYEGPGTSFTVTDFNNGKVNFASGVAAGKSIWFALESNLSNASGPPITVTGTPEPETWALMLAGFGAIGAVMRRRVPTVVAA